MIHAMALGTWTSRALLQWTSRHFERQGIDRPRLAAEMLLAHVLGVDRLRLYMEPDRPASELERTAYRNLVERAAAHEPVDYLVGQSPFFSMMLSVGPAVLIPRPSTETVLEHVIHHARHVLGFHAPLIADIGTGSGAIAIGLARHLDQAKIVATDISPDALKVARDNAVSYGVDSRIEFCLGDLLEPLGSRQFHYLVSNPPYISDEEWANVAPNVKQQEPAIALRGGPDGLRFVRPLIEGAHRFLANPGQLVLEVAASQKSTVLQLAQQAKGLENAHVLVDHESLPRVLVVDRG